MDIKETKEALAAGIAVGKFVVEQLKDGVDWSDALAVGQKFMDPQFRALLQSAIDGADQIPAEIKDCSLSEAVELLQVIAGAFSKAA